MTDDSSLGVTRGFGEGESPTEGAPANPETATVQHPKRVGRYTIEKILGSGGFGVVYLARDEQLQRLVAVKIPHAHLVSQQENAEAYLAEARTVANLDNPAIVPVHDVGSTDECPCYIVSKYVEGADLSAKIQDRPLNYLEAAKLVATIAEALHYAHKQGLVHRDVKPGNILIANDGQPYIVDFGLALREEDIGKGPRYAGTPAYMSPEQARGEGHRVDGRSDVFSLGVVLYESLVGRKPFRGDSQAELLEQVTSFEARPLRQYDEHLPKELERICQKSMSKRASERYTSAHEMAEDLRSFLTGEVSTKIVESAALDTPPSMNSISTPHDSSATGSPATPASNLEDSRPDSRLISVVPKGLRSFDEHDADFFLQLLPGPRDRDGLPDGLRFWKTRIEEMDPDETFPIGLIYGPSGSGKSSFVKAGLLPLVSKHVVPVYIEATPEETESRLLFRLRKLCPALDEPLNLKEALTALRQGRGVTAGRKVLIVLDQFEQWLHAKKEDDSSELVQALRQCDGGRLQSLVMVRDDFWMAATRFMRDLEVRLVEAENSAAVDLFPIRHAEKVLAAYGRAYGVLPSGAGEITKEHKEFLKKSVAGLADEGKVICVRLALFSEMMKGKDWTPAALKKVGGTAGVGITFLEEAFSASSAPPEHRYHQKAARAVLRQLLPDAGTNIKGHMISQAELREISGYQHRPDDFATLVRILDREMRLITPIDPEGMDSFDDSSSDVQAGGKYYQLTHDYLVHPLRDWLTSKQRETWRGRAEIRLAETSQMWTNKPENRYLPSWWEHLNIRLLTNHDQWTEPQLKMMHKAGRIHGVRSALIAGVLMACIVGGLAVRQQIATWEQKIVAQKQIEQDDAEATRLVDGLLQADTSQVKTIIESLADYRRWANDDLRDAFADSPEESNAKLHAALAILPEDQSVLPFLEERLLTVPATQFAYVREQLAPYKQDLNDKLWKIIFNRSQSPERLFHAVCALAAFDTNSPNWNDKNIATPTANYLVYVLPSELSAWRDALRPIKQHLTGPLMSIYRDDEIGERARSFATDILVDYLADDADQLFELLADADERQFAPVFEQLSGHRDRAVELANIEITQKTDENASDEEKIHLAIRKANAAILLVRMDAPNNVWGLLKHSPDPRVRSYFIRWYSSRGGDPQVILDRYESETDIAVRRALLLTVSEFTQDQLSGSFLGRLYHQMLATYENDSDIGIHSISEWLVHRLGQAEDVEAVDVAAIDERLQKSEAELAQADQEISWYINKQGQTFVILDADSFQMGSPETEPGRIANETRHERQIDRRIAVSTKEVTRAQWRAFEQSTDAQVWSADQDQLDSYLATNDCPIIGIKWYEAAMYCNWLSQQEGIPESEWCYEPNEDGVFGPGMTVKTEFWKLTGYRLPTEAEWEFACRAGAHTSRHYGEADYLLADYAWYLFNGRNRAWPTARKKPNDFGLFDMHGNAFEWCHDVFSLYSENSDSPVVDHPAAGIVKAGDARVVRGGSFRLQTRSVRSAFRNFNQPVNRNGLYGLRPVRTFPH